MIRPRPLHTGPCWWPIQFGPESGKKGKRITFVPQPEVAWEPIKIVALTAGFAKIVSMTVGDKSFPCPIFPDRGPAEVLGVGPVLPSQRLAIEVEYIKDGDWGMVIFGRIPRD